MANRNGRQSEAKPSKFGQVLTLYKDYFDEDVILLIWEDSQGDAGKTIDVLSAMMCTSENKAGNTCSKDDGPSSLCIDETPWGAPSCSGSHVPGASNSNFTTKSPEVHSSGPLAVIKRSESEPQSPNISELLAISCEQSNTGSQSSEEHGGHEDNANHPPAAYQGARSMSAADVYAPAVVLCKNETAEGASTSSMSGAPTLPLASTPYTNLPIHLGTLDRGQLTVASKLQSSHSNQSEDYPRSPLKQPRGEPVTSGQSAKGKKEKRLVIIRGLPGSGKTTMAKAVTSQYGVILSSDDFFTSLSGKYTFISSDLKDAHSWNQTRATNCMRNSARLVVIDNTNIRLWEMKPYVQLGLQYGYEISFVQPSTAWAWDPILLERYNTHGVSLKTIHRMRESFEFNASIESVLASEKPKHMDEAETQVAPIIRSGAKPQLISSSIHSATKCGPDPRSGESDNEGVTGNSQTPGIEAQNGMLFPFGKPRSSIQLPSSNGAVSSVGLNESYSRYYAPQSVLNPGPPGGETSIHANKGLSSPLEAKLASISGFGIRTVVRPSQQAPTELFQKVSKEPPSEQLETSNMTQPVGVEALASGPTEEGFPAWDPGMYGSLSSGSLHSDSSSWSVLDQADRESVQLGELVVDPAYTQGCIEMPQSLEISGELFIPLMRLYAPEQCSLMEGYSESDSIKLDMDDNLALLLVKKVLQVLVQTSSARTAEFGTSSVALGSLELEDSGAWIPPRNQCVAYNPNAEAIPSKLAVTVSGERGVVIERPLDCSIDQSVQVRAHERLRQAYPGMDWNELDFALSRCGYNVEKAIQIIGIPVNPAYYDKKPQPAPSSTEEKKFIEINSRSSVPSQVGAVWNLERPPYSLKPDIVNTSEDPLQNLESKLEFHSKKRNDLIEKASQARAEKQFQVASYFSSQAQLHLEKIREIQQQILDHTVDKKFQVFSDTGRLDLHGMPLTYALACLERVVQEGRCYRSKCEVVTGIGIHSTRRVSSIRQAVVNYLEKNGFGFYISPLNYGALTVQL